MRIVLDPDACYLSGECVYNHPALFAFGSDPHPVVLVAKLTTEAEQRSARQAAEVCPSGAITVVD